MAHKAKKQRVGPEHQEAVALLEEMAGCLGLPLDYVQDLAQKVTGRPWEELDAGGAEAVVELLAEALHRHLSRSATPAAQDQADPMHRGVRGTWPRRKANAKHTKKEDMP